MKIVVIGGTGLVGSQVVTDPEALYFGACELDDSTLVPADGALVDEIRFHDWLERRLAAA